MQAASRVWTRSPSSWPPRKNRRNEPDRLMLRKYDPRAGPLDSANRPPWVASKARPGNLLQRMRDRDVQILLFTTDLDVPFSNNGSERDLRPVKTQTEDLRLHRSATGARNSGLRTWFLGFSAS